MSAERATVRARLDVTTWTFHREAPAAVDAARDRLADRWFTVTRAIHWATAGFLLLAVVPSTMGVPTLEPWVLIIGGVGAFVASVVAALWHQHLRTHTGAPVIPVLEDTLEPAAAVLQTYTEMFRHGLGPKAREDFAGLSAHQLRSLQRTARSGLRSQRRVRRQLVTYLELAAQADRRGWQWLRDRHFRTIATMVVRLCDDSSVNPEPQS